MYEKDGKDFRKDSISDTTLREETVSSKCVKYLSKSNQWDRSFSFGKRTQKFSHRDDYSYYNDWKKAKHVSNQYKTRTNSFYDKKQNKNLSRNKREALEFRFGNYHQYYGYRNKGQMDSRIQCMKAEWFSHKDILDVGCNVGHFTLTLARDFFPRSIIGVDIDGELVKMAMNNIRHYMDYEKICEDDFPSSLALSYGPIAQAMDPKGRYPAGNFPFNVQFIQGNYVLPCDELLEEQYECFDTVLCLSITKWIHLNWGDAGIKRLFKRIYYQLRPSGCLILEAQEYRSYAKKKRITEEVFKHYHGIRLFPEMFNEYLVKEVGFETCELIDTPAHSSQGFSRPLYLFTKSGNNETNIRIKPKHIVYHYSSDSHCEDSDVEQLSD